MPEADDDFFIDDDFLIIKDDDNPTIDTVVFIDLDDNNEVSLPYIQRDFVWKQGCFYLYRRKIFNILFGVVFLTTFFDLHISIFMFILPIAFFLAIAIPIELIKDIIYPSKGRYYGDRILEGVIGIFYIILFVIQINSISSLDEKDDLNDDDFEYNYIIDIERPFFHKVSCPEADKINDDNSLYCESRDLAINNGWKPCEICNP